MRTYALVRNIGKIRFVSLASLALMLLVLGIGQMRPLDASAVADSTINFQARLQTSTGGIVPDGNYNIEFKLYNSATGGTALWTEDYLNSSSQGVQTIGGYLTVSLGSITAFPNSINWSQPLWLTMNIGGTSTGTPTWDGEMTPRLPLTAVPYAFQAGSATQLQTTNGSNTATLSFTSPSANDSLVLPDASGTICLDTSSACGFVTGSSTNFIQNATTTQAANFNIQGASSTAASAVIEANSSGTGDLLDLENGSGTIVQSTSNTGNELVKPSTNSSTAFQVQNAAGTAALDVNTSTLTTTLQASVDTATLGSENITTTDFTQPVWTSTGWAVTTTTATHNSGNTSSLVYTGFTPTSGNTYQVTAYFTNNSAGTVGIYLGGNLVATETSNYQGSFTDTEVITVTGTGNLTFIPSSTYIGTISLVSVKKLTANPNPVLIVNNASSNADLQVRASSSTSNLFFGLNSGQDDIGASGTANTAFGNLSLQNNTTGSSNTAVGQSALATNTSGASNTAVGSGALQYNTGGTLNTAVGNTALQNNTTGIQDTAVGTNALLSNTVGISNSAFGYSALSTNTIGINNTAIGNQALSSSGTNLTDEVGIGAYSLQSTSGSSNAALGYAAGQGNTSGAFNIFLGYDAGGPSAAANRNTTGSNNIFFGAGSISNSALQNSDSSALGYDSTVGQSNTVSLGCTSGINSCTTTSTVGIGSGGYAPNALTVSAQNYSTGTITQSTTAITGSGTTFTSAMNNGTIYYSDGTTATVTYVSATSLTSSVSKTVTAGSTYTIVYGGFNVTGNGTAYLQPTTDSTTAFQVQNAAGNNLFQADTTNTSIGIAGASTTAGYALNVTGTGNFSTNLYVNGVAVCTVSTCSAGGGSYINNATTTQSGNFNIQGASTTAAAAVIEENASGTGDLLDLENSSGTIVHSTSATGNELVKPSTNSTSAFQVLNSTASAVLQVSTNSQTDLQGGTDTGSIGINGASISAGYGLNVTGSINATAVYAGGSLVCTVGGCAPIAGSNNYIQNTVGVQTAANFDIQSANSSSVGGVIEAAASQTADLLDLRNSASTNIAEFTSAGYLQGGNASGTNIAGTSINLAGGEGTGTGSGGNLNFDIYKPSVTSGSSLNATASTVFSLSGTNGSAIFQNTTNSTSAFQVQNAAGNSVLNVDSTDSTVDVTQNVASYGTIGAELMTSTTNFTSGWSGTNWTFTSSSATHASGSTTAASYSGFTPVVGQAYQLTFTFSGASGNGTDGVLPSLGGVSGQNIYSASDTNETQVITATGTAGLQFTPTSAWTGSITSVSIKALGSYKPALEVLNATGGELDIRETASSNVLLGVTAGQYLQSGTVNDTGVGDDALQAATTGGNNVAIGVAALSSDTTGGANDALGVLALSNNTIGTFNLAEGGVYALYNNTNGSNNVGLGSAALLNNISGSNNTAVGVGAGNSNQTDTAGTGDTYLGYQTGQSISGVLQNATAIGNDAVVGQSNALILGCINGVNSCASATSVGIGTATPAANLDVLGTGIFQSTTNSTTAFQIQNTAGAPILDVDTTSTAPNGSQLNYLKYPGFESGSFANASAGWAGTSATLTQNNSPANAYNGLYSAKVVTTANPGGITTSSFVSAPPTGSYVISFYAEASSGSLSSNSFVVTSTDGATHTCSPASGTTITTTGFQRLYCSLTTTGSMSAFSITYAATSTTLFIDAVQVQSSTYNGTSIALPTLYQIGGIQLRGVITNPVAIVSTSNSPTTFQVQNATGSTIFSIDTFNTRVVLGSASATPTLIVLGNKNTTGDPTEVDGAMYYNSSLGSFRCGQAGSWTNCIGGLISSNTAASTALTGSTTGVQSFSSTSSIPANYCVSGRVINVTASGILTSTTTAQPINFTLKLGATQVSGTTVALTPAASLTSRGWQMQFQMICDAAPGASSAVTGEGWVNLPGTTSTAADQTSDIPYVATNIATSSAQTLTINATFTGTASASNTITLEQLIVNGE